MGAMRKEGTPEIVMGEPRRIRELLRTRKVWADLPRTKGDLVEEEDACSLKIAPWLTQTTQ